MQITFDVPHVFNPKASRSENAAVLTTLLECLIRVNRIYLKRHPRTKPLYRSGVVYGRTEIWDSIPALYSRGYGDCKSLTAALVAEYREHNIPSAPVFRFNPNSDGSTDYHILVETKTGFEDPSRVLGMGKNENAYFKR